MLSTCSVCSTIFREGSLDDSSLVGSVTRDWNWTPFKGRITASHEWATLHSSRQAYEHGLAHGCKICHLIATIVPIGQIEVRTSFLVVEGQGDVDCDRLWVVNASDGTKLPALSKAICFNLWPTSASREPADFHQLAVRANESRHTGSDEAMQLASQWLRICKTDHQRCKQRLRTAWYPTRLLEIVGGAVKLIVTSGHDMHGPYCTLSHCWGLVPPKLKLTPETVKLLEAGLEIGSLEPTYRDAVIAASFLEFKYIWIDLFCIIQGHDHESHQDWKKESITMDRVYAESLLNMGAAQGSDSYSGCFSHMSAPAHTPSTIIEWAKHYGDEPRYYELVNADHEDDEQLDNFYDSSHLFGRGWITQERILAPRMLHFSAQGLIWECAEGVATQQRPYVTKNNAKSSPRPLPGRLAAPDSSSERSRWIILWCRAVRTYSKAQLTSPGKDKLVAIHGISTRIASLLGETLLFGYLPSTLPWSLCWKSERVAQFSWPTNSVDNERFPSWHFARRNEWILMPRGGPRFWHKGFGERSVQYLMCILDHSLLDPTLPVTPKHLCCLGRSVCLVISNTSSKKSRHGNNADSSRQHSLHLKEQCKAPSEGKRTVLSSTTTSDAGAFWLHLDHELSESNLADHLWTLLPVYISEPRRTGSVIGHCAGLLLQRSADEDLIRAGIFQCEPKNGDYSLDVLLRALRHTRAGIVMIA